MEKIVMYRAADGSIFDNETDCMNHENDLLEMMTYVKKIQEHCERTEICEKCPLWDKHRGNCVCSDDVPANWL